jgi:hypothetical protein
MPEEAGSSSLNVRQRIIEWLDMVAGYPSDPPPWDLSETVNQWYDWNSNHPTKDDYPAPVYTEDEAMLLLAVGAAMERFCAVTPQDIQNDTEEMARPEWRVLVDAVGQALQVIVRKEEA